MAEAADGERQEATPKGRKLMPDVGTEQLANPFKAERVGKPKSILKARLLRLGMMGIRAMAKRTRAPYLTACGWLVRSLLPKVVPPPIWWDRTVRKGGCHG